MRAKACIRCREFIIVRPNDPNNMFQLKGFEKKHSGHTVVILDYNEIKGQYSNFLSKKTEDEENFNSGNTKVEAS